MLNILSQLRSLTEATPPSEVEAVLRSAAECVSQSRVSTTDYVALLRVLTDRVALHISHRALPATSETCEHFDSIFLQGTPHVAFDALAESLRPNNSGVDILARTALCFVSTTGAVRRLTAVISHAPHDGADISRIAAALAHIPSRIANVALSTSDNTLLREDEHACTLARAISNQPQAHDTVRDALVARLLATLVRLGHASQLVSTWATTNAAHHVSNISALAPDTCVAALLRAFLDLPPDCAVFARQALTAFLGASAAARANAARPLQFAVPPLRRPSVAVSRLVSAVRDVGGIELLGNAIQQAATTWSRRRFAMHADLASQKYLTRLMLVYIRAMDDSMSETRDDVMVILAQGVTYRLDHGDERIRRYGMVVGEAFSWLCGDEKRLRFPRPKITKVNEDDDGGDSDFSDIANNMDGDSVLHEETKNELNQTVTEPFSSSVSEEHPKKQSISYSQSRTRDNGSSHKRERRVARTTWEFEGAEKESPAAWELEDDWSSVPSMSSSDESDEEELSIRQHATRKDYEAVRAKVGAPMSITRVLGMLRTANSGSDESLEYDAQLIVSTLRTISARARHSKRADSIYIAAVELSRATFDVASDRFPDEHVEIVSAARRDALLALATLDIESVGAFLITDVAVGVSADLKRRSEALSLLTDAARSVSARGTSTNVRNTSKAPRTKQLGVVTRRSAQSLRKSQEAGKGASEKAVANNFTVCASKLFFLLSDGLSTPRAHSVLAPFAETDTAIYAQAIATLAALLSLSGEGCLQRYEMARALTQLTIRASSHSDTAVRRAAAIAAGSAAIATSAADLAAGWATGTAQIVLSPHDGVSDGLFEWLSRAQEDDSDVLVRRFAAMALSQWKQKVKMVADGQ